MSRLLIALELDNPSFIVSLLPLRSVTQAKRLSHNAITWKRTSIDQVLSSPATPLTTPLDFTPNTPIKTKTKRSLSISTSMAAGESWYGNPLSPIERCISPEAIYCTGRCRDDPSLIEKIQPRADVVSWPFTSSASRADSWWFLNPRSPCLRQRMGNDHGKMNRDHLWPKWVASSF